MLHDIQPWALAKDDGTAVWFLGTLAIVKATAETTRGAYGLIDSVIPAGFQSPYHVHHAEDESFLILEGEVTFICDGKKLEAGPGAYVFGPREIPHGFRVEGTAPARMLFLTTPGGNFERFIIEMGEPATSMTLPPPSLPDMEKLMRLAAKYKIDILGPLPS
jgi:mannose-6-phosphate isomerase-like protein (cupin superfamily)